MRTPEEVAVDFRKQRTYTRDCDLQDWVLNVASESIVDLIHSRDSEILRELEAALKSLADEIKGEGDYLPVSFVFERIKTLFHRDPPVPPPPDWWIEAMRKNHDVGHICNADFLWAEVCKRMEPKK